VAETVHRLETPDDGRAVVLRVAPRADPGAVVSSEAARRLGTVHVTTLEVAVDLERGHELTRDVPNVSEEALAHLDEDGLAIVGTAVGPGDLLVGRIEPRPGGALLSPEEKLLRAIFGEKAGDVRDASLRVPPGVTGAVTAVRRSDDRVQVEITQRRTLAIGDVLVPERGRRAVVVRIEPVDGDVAFGEDFGEVRIVAVDGAEDAAMARSIGPYSLVTQQPLGGKANFGGQAVGYAELAALEARGAWWCAAELLSIKSDDVAGRVRAYEAIVKGEPELSLGTPESVAVLKRELAALGFEVESIGTEPIRRPPRRGTCSRSSRRLRRPSAARGGCGSRAPRRSASGPTARWSAPTRSTTRPTARWPAGCSARGSSGRPATTSASAADTSA
jgi:DNA-directed RNA polymerase beta subunit